MNTISFCRLCAGDVGAAYCDACLKRGCDLVDALVRRKMYGDDRSSPTHPIAVARLLRQQFEKLSPALADEAATKVIDALCDEGRIRKLGTHRPRDTNFNTGPCLLDENGRLLRKLKPGVCQHCDTRDGPWADDGRTCCPTCALVGWREHRKGRPPKSTAEQRAKWKIKNDARKARKVAQQ